MEHFVYFLFDPSRESLLYIGRSTDPRRRLTNFIYRTGVPAVIGRKIVCDSFEESARKELDAIRKHHPPHNKVVVSAPGFLGRKHAEKAKRRSPEFGLHMSMVQAGKTIPPEQRAKLSAATKGRPKSVATREKMRAAWVLRKENKK